MKHVFVLGPALTMWKQVSWDSSEMFQLMCFLDMCTIPTVGLIRANLGHERHLSI